MKRKRGHKKGKSKKKPLKSPASATIAEGTFDNDVESGKTEGNSGSEEEENDKVEEEESKPKPIPVMEVEKPLERRETVVNVRGDGVFQRPPPTAVYGRVKVKLKTAPKPCLESQVATCSEVRVASGAGKSIEVGSVVDKKEDGEVVVGEKVEDSSKKSGSIKIVSLKNSSPPGSKESGVGGGIKILSSKNANPPGGIESVGGGIKTVSSKNSSPLGGIESCGVGGGIKIVSLKNSSPAGGIESGVGGGIKIVSLKNSSPQGGIESGTVGGGIKILSKNSSPPGGIESGVGGIKIVSLKNYSPPGGLESGFGGGNNIGLLKNASPGCTESDVGIKIVSSKCSSSPGAKESGVAGLSPEEKKTWEQEVVLPQREVKYNKQELEASLEVVKKIMKMDAAEPFNVPVDPIKLGIPDYFDVIDTPMDFGTVRNNLESGTKYLDSEDVYKDVQYIWENCYKYNNKGDYIVDLMKRVKKNFMKYWMAAGLYTQQTKKIIGGEDTPPDEPATPGQGRKFKKGKGVKRHKDDCLCAICIMKRRRQEREAREAQVALEVGGQSASPQVKLSKTGMSEEYKQEDNLHAESPVEDTSSYMETSPDGDADAEMEDGGMRPDSFASQYEQGSDIHRAEFRDKSDRYGDISEKSVHSDKGDTELYTHSEANFQDESGSRIKIDAQNQSSVQPEAQATEYMQQRHELLELEKRRQKQRLLETFRDLENPMLLGLCGTLFPNNVQTVWNGAHSLVRCQSSCNRKEIYEAVSSFLNPCKSAASLK
ncbi:hypothetical protein BVRB_6g144900 [Beta vulgaris subsp. vulgaris]|uniref:uncharacterized protein LOC104896894 isoform X1 n=1 Tax=Beta vulgaris subsp. vulgaris TaxID=3555 RepID=UPI00053FCF2D|nr:uncharacterized protein LOC104896894 isoform X1 [Beta vulgaris subsp. vulgaris]KMT07956.1 hypothetical protein BVRB_6g144900 [Beta vulgaris subsp. vulgaris]